MDTVSVIVPVYNISEYLDKCIASVCRQTYPALEILLVDDGSTDDSPEKCDQWADKDNRIRVIHKKNGGLSDARNVGLDAASGSFVYFLDGDDYIEPNLIETALSYMDSDVDLVAFQYQKEWPDGTVKKSPYKIGDYLLTNDQAKAHFLLTVLLRYGIGWEAWSRLFRRDIIEKWALRFVDNRKIFAEDLYFSLCYCSHIRKIVCIPDSLYHYIQRSGSIMDTDSAKLNIGRVNELAKAVYEHYAKCEDCGVFIDVFPAIHYLVITNEMDKAKRQRVLSDKTAAVKIKADIQNYVFFKNQIKALIKNPQLLEQVYSKGELAERMVYLRYILDGSYFALRVRSRLLYHFMDRTPNNHDLAEITACENGNIYVIGTEDFGNIGDHQIAESILQFLKECCPECAVVEITASQYRGAKPILQKKIKGNELIVLTGGGNFGDIYPFAQNLRQDVVDTWPNNPKIIFPQTIYFSDAPTAQEYLARAGATYTKERNVTIFAREKKSFELAGELFSCDRYLVPDIVLSASKQEVTMREQRILLSMRQDCERAVDNVIPEAMIRSKGFQMRRLDNQLSCSVSVKDRKRTIDWVLENYRHSSLVITDRLHGMIFAAITGTPCIVFSNYNHKVRGTYEWIKYLPYIRFAESVADVEKYLPELLEMKDCHYDKTPLEPYFEKLAEVVKKYACN